MKATIMTAKELNRDIKKLNNKIQDLIDSHSTDYYNFIENKGKEEFIRLADADRTMESLIKRNVLIMFRLNQRYRFIPFHQFGAYIELKKEK